MERTLNLDETKAEKAGKQTKKKGIKVHFKPSYAFQCAEFDAIVNEDTFEDVIKTLNLCITMMKMTAPEQPEQCKRTSKKKSGPAATEKQLDLLDKLGVDYDEDITIKEATALIKENIGH